MLLTLALTTLTLADPKPLPSWRLGLRADYHAFYRPRVEVWTNRDDVFARGEGVRVSFRTDVDAYVTVIRVDTDGRLRVLFPREPWEDPFVRGGTTYEARGRSSREAFFVDDYPGVGYVFAVASADPFRFDPILSGDHWDYRVISGGRIQGDPYVALTDFARRILPDGYADWDYDMVPYYVERHYDYPRFLCYDCHGYASWIFWDPYRYSCVRFRIVIYDDPYYYPYRYYAGTSVVFVRPVRPAPRFIFKDRSGGTSYVTRVAQRPVDGTGRREPDRGFTRDEVGGRDVGVPGRRRPADQPEVGGRDGGDDRGRDQPDDRGDRGRRRRPDEPPGRPDDPGEQGRRRRPDEPPGRPQDQGPMVLPPATRRPDEARPEPRVEPVRPVQPREEPRREQPRAEPRREEPRSEPRREQPRAEPPRRDPPRETPRAEPPRREPPPETPRAEPRRESPPPRAEPRREEPKRAPEPELRRRRPDG